jgi:hypothetical protein
MSAIMRSQPMSANVRKYQYQSSMAGVMAISIIIMAIIKIMAYQDKRNEQLMAYQP